MAATSKIMLLNGPNLNMLGVREPGIYGSDTLDDIKASCLAKGAALGLEVDFRQSNIEGELVDWIQSARGDHAGIIINPAAYTHTSVAIMDALLAVELPVIELHLSNLAKREPFRSHSYISAVAQGVICGFGGHGYELAIDAMAKIIGAGSNDA
jgi:3-dehydroquinate dehydratase II